MLKRMIFAVFLVFVPALAFAAMYGLPDAKELKIHVGDKAPLTESEVMEAHDEGKAIILMFGNPAHCIYCEKTWNSVLAVAPKYPDKVAAFVRNHRYSDWSVPEPRDVEFAKEYGVIGEPWVFLIDKSGVVRHIFMGPTGTEALDAKVSELLLGGKLQEK